MTHITIERSAMEAVLKALVKTYSEGYNLPGEAIREAITIGDAALAASWGYRICEFCGCHTNATARACCDAGRDADKAALAQPAQEPWCMKMNGCTTKCEDCPDKPAQEPVSVTYKEVADAMNSLWNGTLEQHQIAEQMANKKLYTTPQQRPWVDLTDEEWQEIVDLSKTVEEAMQSVERKLKEKNA
jgi:hypothetical protein